jgi:hypothetical protein
MTEIRTDLAALSKIFNQLRTQQAPARRAQNQKTKPEKES